MIMLIQTDTEARPVGLQVFLSSQRKVGSEDVVRTGTGRMTFATGTLRVILSLLANTGNCT